MKKNKHINLNQALIILSSIAFMLGCSGGGGGASVSGGGGSGGGLVPTSNQFADDDFDGVLNNKDCAPLDPSKSLVKYQDLDGDGLGLLENSICSSATSFDLGYVTYNLDCNDSNSNLKQWVFRDIDGDGYGDSATKSCTNVNPIPSGYVDNNFDCNDNSVSQNLLKENFKDQDGDGYGTTEVVGYSCNTANAGMSLNKTDCDDGNINNFRQVTLYSDADGDSYGSGTPQILCVGLSNPVNYSTFGGDCNDSNSAVFLSQYLDQDADGYGAGAAVACTNAIIQSGKSFTNTDCNDSDSTKKLSWNVYTDADGDGQGFGTLQNICGGLTIPAQKSANNIDCDDNDTQKRSFSGYYDFDLDTYGSGPVQNYCGSSLPSSYVSNNLDCDGNDNRAWKEIVGYEDDDNDGKGTVSNLIKSCAGKTKNIMHVSNNLDFFPKDAARYLASSLPASTSTPNGSVIVDEAASPSVTDSSGNIYRLLESTDTYASLCSYWFSYENLNKCLVIEKRNSSNVKIWEKMIRSTTGRINDYPKSAILKITQSQDLIIISGYNGSVDLDPNNGTVVINSRTPVDAWDPGLSSFILKLSSAGNYLDHKSADGYLGIYDSAFEATTNQYWILGQSQPGGFNSIGTTLSFAGVLNDDLTFSSLISFPNDKPCSGDGSKFLKFTSQYFLFQCNRYSSNSTGSSLIWMDRATKSANEIPVGLAMARSSSGKIMSLKDGTSYELNLATGLIEVKTSQPLLVSNILYDANNNIVFAGSGYRKCNKVDNLCDKPTSSHDWSGLDDYYQFIIINQKNYFWKVSQSSTLNLKSVDEQNFIINGVMPQLSGGLVPLLYSDVTKTQNTSSAFNINTGFTWSYKH
jgi:hypothetical protein